jgi:RNA polymerase sigma factor FliA
VYHEDTTVHMTTGCNDLESEPNDQLRRAHALFQSELGLVDIMAKQICRSIRAFDQFEDMIAAGREGLLNAAMRYDPHRGIPFRAYANLRVRGSIVDSIRQSSRLSRRAYERLKSLEAASQTAASSADVAFGQSSGDVELPDLEDSFSSHLSSVATAAALALSCAGNADGAEDLQNPDPEEAVSRAELAMRVRSALARLDPDESAIVRIRYFEERTLKQAASELEVTMSWAFRLQTRAVARLAEYLQIEG